MINWLLEQTLLVSILIMMLAWMRYLVLPKISASTWYLAWLCIPFTLFLNTFVEPTSYVPQVSRFTIVPVSSSVTTAQSSFSDPMLFIWLAGVSLVLFYSVYIHVAFELQTRGLCSVTRKRELISAYDGQAFSVVKTDKFHTPFVSGFLKPVIVLPANFHDQFNQNQQALILRHENIHRVRRDPLWNLFAQGVVALFWFNPLVWFGYKLFREAQELSCDEGVLTNETESQKAEYARALLSASTHQLHFSHLTSYGNKAALKARLQRVMQHTSGHTAKDSVTLGALFLITAASTLVFASEDISDGPRLMPVMRIAPMYPATQTVLEGTLTLSFDIETDGSVSNVKVIDSTLDQSSSNVFEEQALLAVAQWRYEKPHSKTNNVKVALDFVQDPATGHTSTDTSMERILVSNQS